MEEEQVTLRCERSLMDQVIDSFGEGVEVRNVTKISFDITVPVEISGTFYAWVFQFNCGISIIAPEKIRQDYAVYLQNALDNVLGE